MDIRKKAIDCVKETVLPIQKKQFMECGNSLDQQYQKYGNTENFFANIIEPGRVYEIGYPRCVCPEVLSGKINHISHCECSRQSVLYILEQLLPDQKITVTTIETVLGGAEQCRFSVIIE